MVRPDIFDEVEDEWATGRYKTNVRHVNAHQRRSRDDGFGHRTTDYLVPEYSSFTTGLHRTKSTGHSPNPNVTIINTTETNPHVHTDQRSPLPSPGLYPQARGRTRRMPGEWDVEDELAELRLEVQKQRSRSRSDVHGYHHGSHSPNRDYDRWQLEAANQRLKEAEERQQAERREELIKRKMDMKYMKDRLEREEEEARIKADEDRYKREFELKHEREERKRIEREKERSDETKRIIAENTAKIEREEWQREQRTREKEEEKKRIILENMAKLEKQEREAQEARRRAVDQFNREQAEKEQKVKEERERVVAEYEAKKSSDAAKAKKQREELVMQLRIEEETRKQKEKEEYERFLLKQKQIQQEEKEKKEKEEQRLEEEMRKRLAQFGFQDNQIKAMIKPDEAAKLQQGMTPVNPMRLGHQPTYVKVRQEHVAVETLIYYGIPYEVDRVSNPPAG